MHACRIHPQRHFEILRGYRDEVLRDGLLRIGVDRAAELRIDGGDLIGAQPRASAKRHMLLRVSHSGETGRRIMAAREVVLLDGRNRGERIAHNHHAQPVIECRADHRLMRIVRSQGSQQNDCK